MSLTQVVKRTIDKDGDHRVSAGDQVIYGFTVTNTGTVALTNVTIYGQRIGAPVLCGRGTLEPKASISCVSQPVTITLDEAKAHSIISTVHANGRRLNKDTVLSSPVTTRRFVTYVAPKTHATATKTAAKRSFSRITLSQSVVKEVDSNHNGTLDAGESLVYGFTVRNTGTTTVHGIHIVDDKLARNRVGVSCADSTIAPGTSLYCQSGSLVVTPYLAKHTVGQNFAYAAGFDSSGTAVRSNSTVTTVGRAIGDVRGGSLAFTGTDVGPALGWSAGLIGAGSVLLMGARLRRRTTATVARRPMHATSGA